MWGLEGVGFMMVMMEWEPIKPYEMKGELLGVSEMEALKTANINSPACSKFVCSTKSLLAGCPANFSI